MPVQDTAGGEDASEAVDAGGVVEGTGTGASVAGVVDPGVPVVALVAGAAGGEGVVVAEVVATLIGLAAAGALVVGVTAGEGVVLAGVGAILAAVAAAGALVIGVTPGEDVVVAGVAAILIGPVALALPVDELFPSELIIDPGPATFVPIAGVFEPDVVAILEGRTIWIGSDDVPCVIACVVVVCPDLEIRATAGPCLALCPGWEELSCPGSVSGRSEYVTLPLLSTILKMEAASDTTGRDRKRVATAKIAQA